MTQISIVGIVGSPRHGNTELLIKEALKSAEEIETVNTELIHLADLQVEPCIGCMRCLYAGDEEERICLENQDDMPYHSLLKADGIIIGSPVYFAGVSAQTKILMDRTEPFTSYAKRERYSSALRNKVGGAIAVGANRNAGQETTIQAIHSFYLVHHMIVVSSGVAGPGYGSFFGGSGVLYPQRGISRKAIEEDDLGLKSSRGVGKRVVEVVRMLKSSENR